MFLYTVNHRKLSSFLGLQIILRMGISGSEYIFHIVFSNFLHYVIYNLNGFRCSQTSVNEIILHIYYNQ